MRHILQNKLYLSAATITFLKKKKDGILLNGQRVTVRKQVVLGDTLTINYDDTESDENPSLIPVEFPLEILYKDKDIIVVNKPPFMPTHPSHDHQTDTLANGLAYYFKDLKKPFVFRAINRLDNLTSGIVLVARNKVSAQHLSDDMARGHIRKYYFAVLHGAVDPACGKIHKPIRRVENSKIKREVGEGGAEAITTYRTIVSNDMYSAMLLSPITGRTHQLRVHFSSLGHCICGDTLYGYPSEYIDRQALHAWGIEFIHPSSGEKIQLTAPIPYDIQRLCDYAFSTSHVQVLKKQRGLYYADKYN